MTRLDDTDRRLIAATQAGLPLVQAPYACIAADLGLTEAQVIDRLSQLQARGVIRRIALAPNHYALGMTANGMSVWDVEDKVAGTLGEMIGALDFVSHCYLRPRAPVWRYNLFAMLHGKSRTEVENKRTRIRALLGPACLADDILYSTRILKKTGLRLRDGQER
ncbi:AsnC family transcriptional regulator [Paracoccus kondratievae]|uniref:siroheme decarboxylase subunit beta n=1 Tax=Paracoccus kondratievae TaxID=135740 RepID=UPI0012663053|nr:AsnC family transcriptional regulator [Paracoccus kondratievae]QFQ86225.1 AsnC family transcriptional regulator [Paracoccus kondratievae]